MISYIAPLPIGNAVRVLLSPPDGSSCTRVLRNTTGTFAGATPGPSDSLVFDGQDAGFIDATALLNGTTYYYGAFDLVDDVWVASPVKSCVPAATLADAFEDVLTLVRDRLKAGLKTYVDAGRLQHDNGSIPVLTAPPLFENTVFPAVSVHLRGDSAQEFGIGDDVLNDPFDPDAGGFVQSAGWLSSVTLDIMVWVVGNPDTRIALRQAVRSVLLGNLIVFGEAALSQIQVSQSDQEDFESYGAPVYIAQTTFSCLAPAVVTAPSEPLISDASVAEPF